MKRILILVALGLFLCSTGSAFQGGGGESTKKESTKKKVVTKKKTSGTPSANTTPKPPTSAVRTRTPPPAPATAELNIRSTPPNCSILIDGQPIGVTDENGLLNLPAIKPGEHIIIGRKERYRDAQRTILLEANRNETAQLDLSPMPGTLNVSLNVRGALIEVSDHGNYAGTVSNLELDAGSYSIKASKPGYRTATRKVDIEAGLHSDVSLALELAGEADPELAFVGRETFRSGGRNWTRYKLTVTNRTAYSQDMFAPAPDLPPCGANTKASRTWVDIYDRRGKRLNGFCALGKPDDLHGIWFALEEGVIPSEVFVVLSDRLSKKEYKSNLAAIP